MYFTDDIPVTEFIPTGCTLLDLVMGQGIPVGRLVNIQGDSASGKTFIAEKAAANHLTLWPDGYVGYADTEKAFDFGYATRLGIPIDKIDFIQDLYTIEDWFNYLQETESKVKDDSHSLLILDSIDALSSEAEMDRKITDSSFGGERAKKMSETLRRINAKCAKKNITILTISQLRDAVSSPVPMKIRSGGKAIEYYSSLVVKLSVKGKLKKTIKGIEKIVGSEVLADCTKNKVGLPFRKANLSFIFNKGIDDVLSNLEYLASGATGKLPYLEQITPIGGVGLSKSSSKSLSGFLRKMKSLDNTTDYNNVVANIEQVTRKAWREIEDLFDSSKSDDDEE